MAMIPKTSVALVVGVTGMAGLSLAEALKKPTALGGPWKVYGSARSKPTWFPSSSIDRFITFDATNVDDTFTNLSPISNEVTHLFWVALQIHPNPEVHAMTNSAMLKNVLDIITSAKSSQLRHVTLQTGTDHYRARLIRHDPPFHEDMPRLPYPNFYFTLEDVLASYAPSFSYSIHGPSIIIGASSKSTYNIFLGLSVYANICKRQGLPFRYPGNRYTWEHFCDMTDSSVLAQQHIWAAVSEEAKNQAFNCTNGDVFSWKSLWKELCKVFDVEFVPFDEKEKFDLVDMMKMNGSIWDMIVEEHGLLKTKMEDLIITFHGIKGILNWEFQQVSSMTE